MWAVVFRKNVVFFSESDERVVQERDKFYSDPARHGIDILHKWPTSELNRIGIYLVQDHGTPEHDRATQRVVRKDPIYDQGLLGVRFDYEIVDMSPEEVDRRRVEDERTASQSTYQKFIEAASPDQTVEGALLRVITALLELDQEELRVLRSILTEARSE